MPPGIVTRENVPVDSGMVAAVARQRGFAVRFGWGADDLAVLGSESDALVIVDVLSFTSAVSVAVGRGARVWPYRFRDASAAAFAAERGAELAVSRGAVGDGDGDGAGRGVRAGRWTLSPAALVEIPAGTRLVLPSPNGSALSAAAAAIPGIVVAAGCLRNAAAVGGWLAADGLLERRGVAVIAAGERWPDADGRAHAGPLRPAVEDLLGAGAVIARIVERAGLSPRADLSPEARAALAAFRAARADSDLLDELRRAVSGRELRAGGWDADVVAAAALDADEAVPVLTDGAYERVTPTGGDADWR